MSDRAESSRTGEERGRRQDIQSIRRVQRQNVADALFHHVVGLPAYPIRRPTQLIAELPPRNQGGLPPHIYDSDIGPRLTSGWGGPQGGSQPADSRVVRLPRNQSPAPMRHSVVGGITSRMPGVERYNQSYASLPTTVELHELVRPRRLRHRYTFAHPPVPPPVPQSSRVDDFTLNRDAEDTMRDANNPLASEVMNYYRERGGGSQPTRTPEQLERGRQIVQERQLRIFGRR